MSHPNPPPGSKGPRAGQERGTAAPPAADVDDYRDILDAWYPSQAPREQGTTAAGIGRGDASVTSARPAATPDLHR